MNIQIHLCEMMMRYFFQQKKNTDPVYEKKLGYQKKNLNETREEKHLIYDCRIRIQIEFK